MASGCLVSDRRRRVLAAPRLDGGKQPRGSCLCVRISCAGKREATSALPRLTPPSDTQASVSTVVFLLPPRSEAVHDHQRVLRTVFTIKAFFQEKSNRSFQSQEAASRPSPSFPSCGSSPGGDPTRYPRNSAKRPSASPTRFSSWAEGSTLLAGHMILRSFRADSRLWEETSRTDRLVLSCPADIPPPPAGTWRRKQPGLWGQVTWV